MPDPIPLDADNVFMTDVELYDELSFDDGWIEGGEIIYLDRVDADSVSVTDLEGLGDMSFDTPGLKTVTCISDCSCKFSMHPRAWVRMTVGTWRRS